MKEDLVLRYCNIWEMYNKTSAANVDKYVLRYCNIWEMYNTKYRKYRC